MSKIKIMLVFFLIFGLVLAFRSLKIFATDRHFVYAARSKDFQKLKEFLPRVSNIDVIASDDWTALTAASQTGDIKMVRYLLENGANVNALDGAGHSAIFWASFYGNNDIIRLLISKGGDPLKKCDDCRSPRETALTGNYTSTVKLLDEAIGIDRPQISLKDMKQFNCYPTSPKILPKQFSKMFQDRLKDGSLGPQMIWIPAGSFCMGDLSGNGFSNEKPVHQVPIHRFAMGKYEITNAEFVHFLNAVHRRGTKNEPWFKTTAENSYNHITGYVGHFLVENGYEDHPMTNVSWYGATAYSEWLAKQTGKQYRLPTEAEFEYAARAGTITKYWWGNIASDHEYANYGKNGYSGGLAIGKDRWKYTSPVGSFPPNPFGLYDTAGNAFEWTCSEYENKYRGKEQHCFKGNNNNAKNIDFVMRGGSWYFNGWALRSANRICNSASGRNRDDGFRLVRM